jgi:hypothetical protein
VIPSGGIIIFYEHIVHEVVSRSLKYPSIRLFLGWRLTTSVTPLITNLDTLIDNQAVMPLKSNQYPAMYAKLNWVNSRLQLQTWSKRMMQPICLETKQVGSGKDKGIDFVVANRQMGSLRDYGFPLYGPYSEFERRILKPHKTFQLRPVGHSEVRKGKVTAVIRENVSLYSSSRSHSSSSSEWNYTKDNGKHTSSPLEKKRKSTITSSHPTLEYVPDKKKRKIMTPIRKGNNKRSP